MDTLVVFVNHGAIFVDCTLETRTTAPPLFKLEYFHDGLVLDPQNAMLFSSRVAMAKIATPAFFQRSNEVAQRFSRAILP